MINRKSFKVELTTCYDKQIFYFVLLENGEYSQIDELAFKDVGQYLYIEAARNGNTIEYGSVVLKNCHKNEQSSNFKIIKFEDIKVTKVLENDIEVAAFKIAFAHYILNEDK